MLETFSTRTPTKGEIFYVLFTGEGSVQKGPRPAVVVQTDFLNRSDVKTTLVCPLTSRLRNLATQPIFDPTPANGLRDRCALMGEQVTTINKSQLERKLGTLSEEDIKRVENALLRVFDIDMSSQFDGITL